MNKYNIFYVFNKISIMQVFGSVSRVSLFPQASEGGNVWFANSNIYSYISLFE